MKSKYYPLIQSLSRRRFAVLLTGLAASLSGCSDQSEVSAVSPREEAGKPSAPSDQSKVVVYSWDEYIDPELKSEFEKRTGITLEVVTFESSDEMVDMLKSEPGRYDVFVAEDGYIEKIVGKRLAQPLDKNRMPNWKNLDPKFLDAPFDPKNQFTVPYLWGTTLIAYNKNHLPNPQQSWKIILQPELKNHVSFLDDWPECYSAVLRTMETNLPEADTTAINQAADALLNMVGERGARLGSDIDMKQHIIEGSAWVAMMYSGDAARIARENPELPIGYFIPREGATVWTDSFCLSSDSTRLDNAYKFLDFMLEAKTAAKTANCFRYASPNKAAVEFIDAALLADPTIYPSPEILAKCSYFKLRNIDSQRALNTGWRKVQETWHERISPPLAEASGTGN
jgi:spermidine/putrescine transport system substrate-binding protein